MPGDARPAHSATRAVRAGVATDREHGAVIPPLHLSSTFSFAGFAEKRRYDYTRSGNPTRDLLAEALADLEEGEGATVTGSGMSAVALVLQLLRPGDRVVAAHDCYGGTYRALTRLAERGHFEVEFAALHDPAEADRVIRPGVRMVWVESPSNPLLRITDLARVAARATAVGALSVVDNTFLSPARQRPLALGADLVVHSTTKYLNGHSDVVGGAVVARDAAVAEALAWWANCLGLAGSPFDAWLTLRGLRTLPVRMRAHEENAAGIVDRLVADPRVAQVHYPGLPSHPGHATARRQQSGFGAIVSFDLRAGEAAVRRFVDGLRWFTLAESLGGVESLVAHPATMTHASMDAAARQRAGIGDGLLRLSVGVEDQRDLILDLDAALKRAAGRQGGKAAGGRVAKRQGGKAAGHGAGVGSGAAIPTPTADEFADGVQARRTRS